MPNPIRSCQYCHADLPSNLIPRHEAGCIGSPPSLDRLFIAGRVTRTDSGCLVWQAKIKTGKGQGYGILTSMSAALVGEERANRAALVIAVGPSPGHRALHSCDNPPCVNPEHLRWGTQKENMADAKMRERASAPPRTRDLPRETVTCPVCASPFTRPVGGSVRVNETCGRSCGTRLARSRRNPNWVDPRITRVDRI